MVNNGHFDFGKVIFGIISVVILSAGLYITSFYVKTPKIISKDYAVESQGPILAMSPNMVSTTPGQTFQIGLILDTKSSTASAVQLEVAFDPGIVKANSVVIGSFLPVILRQATIDNSKGLIDLTLGCRPTEPKIGIGQLASISFTALSSGDININYTDKSQLAVIGLSTNGLSSSTGVRVVTVVPTTKISISPIPILTNTALPTPSPTLTPIATDGSTVEVYAAGQMGGGKYPNMQLLIDKEIVLEAFGVAGNPASRQFIKYTYHSPLKIIPKQIRVRFTNDYHNFRSGSDRNLMVDKIVIDKVSYQSEAQNVYSTGSWSKSLGCRPGRKQSEWLNCNGYFQY